MEHCLNVMGIWFMFIQCNSNSWKTHLTQYIALRLSMLRIYVMYYTTKHQITIPEVTWAHNMTSQDVRYNCTWLTWIHTNIYISTLNRPSYACADLITDQIAYTTQKVVKRKTKARKEHEGSEAHCDRWRAWRASHHWKRWWWRGGVCRAWASGGHPGWTGQTEGQLQCPDPCPIEWNN